ncbi:MAG TPA: xanthine dehydrogenase family protein subunit M [Jiangellaceae bacterium]|nr:xanthine dehydrogenase family protein subunit M [Jiangellaceae bacterium]
MKPPPFVYHRPSDVDEALGTLAEFGSDGKILAGGQSLVPLMSMRLAAPAHLIDINGLSELGDIRVGHDGVEVGATVRHAQLELDAAAFTAQPLLRQALQYVAHPTIRNRGTSVGSLAHADPAGELTAVLALLGGKVTLRNTAAVRTVAAADFFLGPLESAVRPDELATSAFFPELPPRTGSAWTEVSRRNGDYAICGVGAIVTLDDDRRIASARVGLISVAPTPVVVDVGESLTGRPADAVSFDAAARQVEDTVDPEPDIHATAEYRRHLAGVLTQRALGNATDRAMEATT